METKTIVCTIFILLLCSIAAATPTTGAATAVGSNNATVSCSGVTGTAGWIEWGTATGSNAKTFNQTPIAGSFTYNYKGGMTARQKYYYKCCDSTGCGVQSSFTTIAVTTTINVPTQYWGYFTNMTENQFDSGNAVYNFLRPYTDIGSATLFYAILLAMIFGGMWLRSRRTDTSLMFSIICAGLFLSSAVALQLGVPPEFIALAQALMYISLTAAIVSFTFK